MRYCFGDFTLDVDRHLLLRQGEEIHLSPKAFRLLEILLERRPKVLSKGELHDLLWPGTFVSESNLAGLIAELRASLADRARDPLYIRTRHAFGYSFVGEATLEGAESEQKQPSQFSLSLEGRDVRLFPGSNIIGRDPGDTIFIDDPAVSRKHATIEVTDEAILLDHGSKNGTFVNGTRIKSSVKLVDGDVLHVGAVRMVFRVRSAATSTVTLHRTNVQNR